MSLKPYTINIHPVTVSARRLFANVLFICGRSATNGIVLGIAVDQEQCQSDRAPALLGHSHVLCSLLYIILWKPEWGLIIKILGKNLNEHHTEYNSHNSPQRRRFTIGPLGRCLFKCNRHRRLSYVEIKNQTIFSCVQTREDSEHTNVCILKCAIDAILVKKIKFRTIRGLFFSSSFPFYFISISTNGKNDIRKLISSENELGQLVDENDRVGSILCSSYGIFDSIN